MNQTKRIFIIGHPGAGKTLLAKTVAQALRWQFVDADFGLEFQIGRNIIHILGKQGVESFSNCQSEILSSLCHQENIVVATDASVVCSETNRQLLQKQFTVFLHVDTATQIQRTSRNVMPLLAVSGLENFFDELHGERDSLYHQAAQLIINSDNTTTLEEHTQCILDTISAEVKQVTLKSALNTQDITIFHKESHAPIHLSNQQALCLKLLAQGKSSKEIAREIHISYRTVEGTFAKVMELLGCASSKELIALYHSQP